MDAARDDHTKWSKSERERQILCDITYMWSLNHGANEPIYKIGTYSQTQRTDSWFPRGKWRERGMEGELGVSRYKLLYTFRMDKQQGPPA